MKRLFVLTGLILLFFMVSCRKDAEVIVPGNQAPPDKTVSNATIEVYINKVYIGLLGREPLSAEYTIAWNLLRQGNLSVTSRDQFLNIIQGKSEYLDRLYTLARIDLLNNLDTTDIKRQINLYTVWLTDSTKIAFWDIFEQEKSRLELLRAIPADLNAGSLGIRMMHRRCAYNYFYDQINMGTLNFVTSMFQSFLYRYPTVAELDAAIKMVNGQTAIFFLKLGKSKPEFLDIFFDSDDYYEGQVRSLYLRYLLREPSSTELSAASAKYRNDDNYQDLQKDILLLNEYAGI